MTKRTPYMNSRFKRRKDDNYHTIDSRCIDAFLFHFGEDAKRVKIVDICAPTGSAIVDYLKERKYKAVGIGDAFQDKIPGQWIVTNTPYQRKIVKPMMINQIKRVTAGELGTDGLVAFLLRTGFDHAQDYAEMFDSPYYHAEIKMRFRPWWTKSRRIAPFHNFVWHIFRAHKCLYPMKLYYTPPFDPAYAVQNHGKAPAMRRFHLYLSNQLLDLTSESKTIPLAQHIEYFSTQRAAEKCANESLYQFAVCFETHNKVCVFQKWNRE